MLEFATAAVTHTHTLFNCPLSGTTRVSRYQKGKTNLDFTEARDSEWQWHQLGHMQHCTSLQTDNHASTPLLSFLQAGCPSCRPTNSVKHWRHRRIYVCNQHVICIFFQYCGCYFSGNHLNGFVQVWLWWISHGLACHFLTMMTTATVIDVISIFPF